MRISTPLWLFLAVAATLIPWTTPLAQPVCDPGGPYAGFVGEPIQFDGTGSHSPGGTIVSYEWSFGDGATGTGPTPQHTYTVEGVYIVALTVTDDQNATSSCETSADINPLPVEAVTWGRIKAIYR